MAWAWASFYLCFRLACRRVAWAQRALKYAGGVCALWMLNFISMSSYQNVLHHLALRICEVSLCFQCVSASFDICLLVSLSLALISILTVLVQGELNGRLASPVNVFFLLFVCACRIVHWEWNSIGSSQMSSAYWDSNRFANAILMVEPQGLCTK